MIRRHSERERLGIIIAQHRKEKKWTQFQLARESGVPVTAIRRLEQSDQIQLSQFRKIVSALGARLEILPQAKPVASAETPKSLHSQECEGMVSTHRKHENRSLLMHQIIERLFRRSPERVIEHGLNNILRWRENGVDCKDLRTWESILRNTPQKLPKILSGTDEVSIRLRQSSPFPGLVTQKQRQKIFEAHR